MRTTTILRAVSAGAVSLALSVSVLGTPANAAPVTDDRPMVKALNKAQKDQLQRAVTNQIKASTKKGVQTAANEVTYYSADGQVEAVAVIPLPGETVAPAYSNAAPVGAQFGTYETVKGCDWAWYCFYEHGNWGGTRWQFRLLYEGPPAYASTWGFNDKVSSWVVNTGALYVVADDAAPNNTGQWLWLWTTPTNSLASYVGDTNNDRMDRWWAWAA